MNTVLAIGAPSSGNRLLMRMLSSASPALELVLCKGHGSKKAHPITLPHNGGMPDIDGIIAESKANKIIVLQRDRTKQAKAAVRSGHAIAHDIAVLERLVADAVMAGIRGDVYYLSYDLLCIDPGTQMANLGDWLGVKFSLMESIYERAAA